MVCSLIMICAIISDITMSVVEEYNVHLNPANIIRRQGIREYAKTRPEIREVIGELTAAIDEKKLVRSRFAYEIYPAKYLGEGKIQAGDKTVLKGKALESISKALEIAAVVCTIGEELEKKAGEYFAARDPLRGMLLDGIGSAAVDAVSQQACRTIADLAASRGFQTSSPLGPGMPDFPITEQYKIYKLSGAVKIGVTLSSSGMLIPRKSVSMVIGMGQDMARWTQAEVCRKCPVNDNCTHRVIKGEIK